MSGSDGETAMHYLSYVAIATVAWLVASCGCAASNERRSEQGSTLEKPTHEAWGANFALPSGFSGGENDAGGIELTDGEIAIMVGRQPMGEGESFEAFAEARRRSLADLGAAQSLVRSAHRIGDQDGFVFSGRGADGVELRLLLVPLDPRTGLSFLLIGEASRVTRLDVAWTTLLGSLELPK